MGFRYKYRPSKQARVEFAQKMQEIEAFCEANNIETSLFNDSYYFTINGQKYRVSNHSVEASNNGAFNDWGDQIRPLYHKGGRQEDTIYIHASKTRLIEIYNNLKAGHKLDGRGNIKD